MDVVQKEPQEPEREREDPTELARPSGVVTTGTTGASAETESGTEGGEAPVAEKEALHTKAKRKKECGGIENPLLSKYLP